MCCQLYPYAMLLYCFVCSKAVQYGWMVMTFASTWGLQNKLHFGLLYGNLREVRGTYEYSYIWSRWRLFDDTAVDEHDEYPNTLTPIGSRCCLGQGTNPHGANNQAWHRIQKPRIQKPSNIMCLVAKEHNHYICLHAIKACRLYATMILYWDHL